MIDSADGISLAAADSGVPAGLLLEELAEPGSAPKPALPAGAFAGPAAGAAGKPAATDDGAGDSTGNEHSCPLCSKKAMCSKKALCSRKALLVQLTSHTRMTPCLPPRVDGSSYPAGHDCDTVHVLRTSACPRRGLAPRGREHDP